MAEKFTDVPEIEESQEMECEDTPPDSEHSVVPPRSTASGGVSSNVGTTSGSGSDKIQLELPTQDSAVSPKGSPRSSPATSPKSKKAAVISGLKESAPGKLVMKAIDYMSPKKSDKAAKVPKDAKKKSTAGPSSADKTSAATSSGSRGKSPKKSDKAAKVPKDAKKKSTAGRASADETSAATSSGSRDKKPESQGGVKCKYVQKFSLLDYSSSEEDTVLTEVSDPSRQLLPDELGRKVSISSCDTGAHISMLPSLDESGAEKTADLSDDEGESTRASTEKPLGGEQ